MVMMIMMIMMMMPSWSSSSLIIIVMMMTINYVVPVFDGAVADRVSAMSMFIFTAFT